ncbi:MAG TPA: MucB/RseB C-terminal domain-containing protein [Noviherbaspirillum sp.]
MLRFVVTLSVFLTFSASAETADPAAEARNARGWLKKIQTAAQHLNYTGTFVYQQGSEMRTSRITHIQDSKGELEKLEVLDGRPREYIRKNDEVICYVPETKTLLVEKRTAHDVFPAILATNSDELGELYDVRRAESGRVAGRECQAILLEPKDKLRYGYKLWADKASGLLLRAQTLNDKGETVEQIAFTHISIGDADRSKVKPSFPNTEGWRVENALMSQVNLSAWSVKSLPPGFRKVREVKRLVSDTSTAGGQSVQRDVSQIVYSDGLAAISVFIEPGSQSRTEGSMQQGAVNIVGKRQGDYWLTIVGEVPLAAIRQVANSVEFKSR